MLMSSPYSSAYGIFGGILFDLKWLYHSVAKKIWHLDRRLWRIFTPLISGGLAFAFIICLSSNLITIFDQNALGSTEVVLGISFLVGYFSDSASAKLTEVANTLFGTSRKTNNENNKET